MEGVRVDFTEVAPREQVKQAGGKWNRSRRVWELYYERVVALKLEARIVEGASNTKVPGHKFPYKIQTTSATLDAMVRSLPCGLSVPLDALGEEEPSQ